MQTGFIYIYVIIPFLFRIGYAKSVSFFNDLWIFAYIMTTFVIILIKKS